MIDLENVVGFDWDAGNEAKNEKHGVSVSEIEQLFFNRPIVLVDDIAHSSETEFRYHAFGTTDKHRLLHITFVLRDSGSLIRPISARPMSRKERSAYAKAVKTNS